MFIDSIKLRIKQKYPFLIKKYRDIKVSKNFNENYWNKKKIFLLKIVNDFNTRSFDSKLPKKFSDISKKEDHAILEINNTCNIDCLMCRTSLATRKKGKISDETLQIALKRLKEDGIKNVSLHTIGDPLANPRLEEVFKELRKNNIHCSISTNGLLLYKHVDVLKEYLDVCPSIRISIDGATKKTYEKIRNKGKWEDLIYNLDLCSEKLRSSSLSTDINMTISKDNYKEIGQFIIFFSKYVSYPFLDLSFNFVNSLSPDTSYFHDVNLLPEHTHINKMCGLVTGNTSFVLFDGKVSVCCRDYSGELIIGDIKDKSLSDIRKSKELNTLQKAHTNGNLKNYNLCKNCFRVDDRINIIFNGSLQYLIYKNPNQNSKFFQLKVNELVLFFQEHKLNEKKILEIIN